MRTLTPELVRHLDLGPAGPPASPAFIAAASGLVLCGGRLFVVADDELHLGVFDWPGTAPGRLLRLLPGELPRDAAARKARKPDFEALTDLIPSGDREPALLAVPSGSTVARTTGALIPRCAGPLPGLRPAVCDFSGLMTALRGALPFLNVEGAAVTGDRLWLASRGNTGGGHNALIALDLQGVRTALAADRRITGQVISRIIPVRLGAVAGIDYGLTDLCALPDGRLGFAAAAEDTANAYDDGKVIGSCLGTIDPEDGTCRSVPLTGTFKVEGLHVSLVSGTPWALMVTDADDREHPACLLKVPFVW